MFKTSKEIKKIVVLAFAAALVFSGCSVESKGSDSEPESVSDTDDSKTGEEDSEKNESEKSIKLNDLPVGFADVTVQAGLGTTVTSRAELLSAVSKGGLIYVKGTIDMSDGCLPGEAGGSTAALDKFVAEKSKGEFADYTDFKTKYAASCSSSTDDKSSSKPQSSLGSEMWNLNRNYGEQIKIKIKSDTTIIGLEDAVIKGGTIQISGVSNVIIRNIRIQDGYDPFPHHESGDGFNAQWDGVCIDSSKNIWIDHCVFEDTMKYSMVDTSSGEEKWQTYDGLCDIKGDATNITVSNCIFKNHDKTMLIGSSDSDGDNSKRFVTLYGNYFLNCVQRLPMVRNTTIHIFNNYYDSSNQAYSNSYAIGRRKNCIVYAENNYFGSGIKYSIKETNGELHSSGNKDLSKNGATSETDDEVFSSLNKYKYTVLSASDAKTSVLANAGAGCTLAD